LHEDFGEDRPLDSDASFELLKQVVTAGEDTPWSSLDEHVAKKLEKAKGEKPTDDEVKEESKRTFAAKGVFSYGLKNAAKRPKGHSMSVVTSKDGRPSGMAFSYDRDDGDMELDALSTDGTVKGMGTYLMARTIKKNLKEGQNVRLSALPGADGFYEHIGMKKVSDDKNSFEGHDYSMDHDTAHDFADKVYDKLGLNGEEKVASIRVGVFQAMVERVMRDFGGWR